jgi:hypothetical protein
VVISGRELHTDFARFLLMAGGSIFIVGFAIAADHGFGRPDSYALIVVGTVLLGLSVVNFLYTKRNAVIPAVSEQKAWEDWS